MLKVIVQHTVQLVAFLTGLKIALYQSQIRHLTHLVDALLVCQNEKTLTNLYRQIAGDPDPKTAADFFRESTWAVAAVSSPRKQFMVMTLLAAAKALHLNVPLLIGIDDSLGEKGKATRHLEAVDFHHNHSEGSSKKPKYANGFVYVEVHLQLGPIGCTFDLRLYLREKTVRRLNRQRDAEHRLHYCSKYALARAMLVELQALLPKGYPVYVLFDSWYASAKLIKFCRRQGWHVICAIKSNRRIDKKRIDQHDLALKHKHYQRVTLEAVDPRRPAPRYYVRSVQGRLEEVPGTVCALISRRHPGDKRPKFFACTDLDLSVEQALRYYQKRWPVEVDNVYLKEALGLGDFRLQSFAAIERWFAVVTLAINYLQYEQMLIYLQTQQSLPLAEVIRQHRLRHFQGLLRSVIQEALSTGKIEEVIQQFLPVAGWAVT
jgi:Transposase DDE domain